MRINVGCVDGKTYSSVPFTREEIEKQLDEVDGYIGTGDLASERIDSVEEAIEFLMSNFKYDASYDTQTATMDTLDYGTVSINVRHIVWWSLTGDTGGDPWSS